VVVLLTGGSGFIGRHVRAALSRRKVSVRLLSRTPLTDLSVHESMVIRGIGEVSVEDVQGIDTLIHLAWDCLDDFRSEDHLTKVLPEQINFIKTVCDSSIKHLVIAGTCLEYGPQSGELSELAEIAPSVPYAQAKDELRKFSLLHLSADMSLTWCRIFYPYGPGQSETSLYSAVVRASREGTPLHMSHGKQRRDFIRVERVAEILVELALTRRYSGTVNVASGLPRSVEDLVHSIVNEERLHLSSIIRDLEVPSYEPIDFWASTATLNQVLS